MCASRKNQRTQLIRFAHRVANKFYSNEKKITTRREEKKNMDGIFVYAYACNTVTKEPNSTEQNRT